MTQKGKGNIRADTYWIKSVTVLRATILAYNTSISHTLVSEPYNPTYGPQTHKSPQDSTKAAQKRSKKVIQRAEPKQGSLAGLDGRALDDVVRVVKALRAVRMRHALEADPDLKRLWARI